MQVPGTRSSDGSFQFSGPRKYSYAHVNWPKKAKITFRRGCGGASITPINKLSIFDGLGVN